MVTWQKFNKYFLPNKYRSSSSLNIENISEYDYEHSKEVWNTFEIKILGDLCSVLYISINRYF